MSLKCAIHMDSVKSHFIKLNKFYLSYEIQYLYIIHNFIRTVITDDIFFYMALFSDNFPL